MEEGKKGTKDEMEGKKTYVVVRVMTTTMILLSIISRTSIKQTVIIHSPRRTLYETLKPFSYKKKKKKKKKHH